MQPELIAKYGQRRIPRYTSYPTAPHFTQEVGEDAYRDWLIALPEGSRLSLYLHIPYCRSMCWYCGCHTRITMRDAPIASYTAALRREIEQVAALVSPTSHSVVQVHWGGGTPTIVGPETLREVMALLRAGFAFEREAEIAVEIDPRRITPAMADALGEAGVTRASLGVQTFDPRVQQAINRVQGVAQVKRAAELLRAAGVSGFNVDLLYGLPHQTAASCEHTVRQVLDLSPDRLSVFGYAHVPWMKAHQRMIEEAVLPDVRERFLQFEAIGLALDQAGYQRIGLDHFARPEESLARARRDGSLRRNFQGYTADPADALLGFGASAIGTLPQGYVQNTSAISHYTRRINAGSPATMRGIPLTSEDRLRRDVIERIMCLGRVDLAAEARRHGLPESFLADGLDRLHDLEADGLVEIKGSTVSLAAGAWPFVRNVAAAFDTYLAPSPRRHASAV